VYDSAKLLRIFVYDLKLFRFVDNSFTRRLAGIFFYTSGRKDYTMDHGVNFFLYESGYSECFSWFCFWNSKGIHAVKPFSLAFCAIYAIVVLLRKTLEYVLGF